VGQGFDHEERVYLSVLNVMVSMAPVRGSMHASTLSATTARPALLLAAISTGASLQPSKFSMHYISAAKEHLRECYLHLSTNDAVQSLRDVFIPFARVANSRSIVVSYMPKMLVLL
jgi:hypothetical protein